MAGHMCVTQKNKLADEQLNTEYKKAIKRTKGEETALRQNWPNTELVSLFRSAQRAWLKFRDAECEFHRNIVHPISLAGRPNRRM